jgi:hypothetical protein
MKKLTRADLMPLEQYAERRPAMRAEVIAHKGCRQVRLNDHVRLLFEDRITIQYQVQEMLRAERIFEPAGIQDELDAYNPLIPDGDNWKATLMIEYEDVAERRRALMALKGIEREIWAQVAGFERVNAIADEDLERENDEKTASVHFLRFQLTAAMAAAVKAGAAIGFGSDHPACRACVSPLAEPVRAALAADIET